MSSSSEEKKASEDFKGNKRSLTEASEDLASTLGDQAACSVDDKTDGSEKKLKTEPSETSSSLPATEVACADGSEVSCGICLEGSSDGKVLIDHACSQCTPGAWMICEQCHEGRLSRSCPVCNNGYAPLVLQALPTEDEALTEIDSNLSQEKKVSILKSLQFTKLKLISLSNVAVWDAFSNTMKFSLPVDATKPPKEIRYMLASLTLSPSAVNCNGQFMFTNSTWDLLESAFEENESTEEVDIRGAMGFIMGALVPAPTATSSIPRLFTCVSLENLQELLHPNN